MHATLKNLKIKAKETKHKATKQIVTRKGLRIPTNPVRDAMQDNLSFPGNGANLFALGFGSLGSTHAHK